MSSRGVDPEEVSPFDAILESIERLPEGSGDEGVAASASAEEESEADEDSEGEVDEPDLDEAFLDESNPFYAAKKAAAKGANDPSKPAKPVYQDSSQAASDILKKMLERRRAPR